LVDVLSLSDAHILCSPASYVLDGEKGGSEPLWAHNIVREIGKRARSVTAITGYVESARLPPNVKIVTVGGRPGENFLAASVAARFTLQAGAAAIKEFLARRPAVFHHILPFGLGQTFNPIQPILGNTPLVVGPIQGESYRRHFEQISLGGIETKQRASTSQPLSNRLAAAAGPLLRELNRRFVRRADAIIAVSEEAVAFLSGTIDPAKLHVIPPGVDTATFSARPPHESEEVVLITAGYLLKRKRIDVVLRALAALRDRGTRLRLLVAGDGPEREALRELAGELGVQDQVEWLGFIENRALAPIYHRADVYVSASEHEGLPTAYLEAFSTGLPLVCADNAGSRAVITEPERGVIVPQEDHEAMAGAISRYTNSRPQLEKMAAHVREVAASQYDWSVIGDRYAAVYEKAALHRAGRP
jgi:hypothetical protein